MCIPQHYLNQSHVWYAPAKIWVCENAFSTSGGLVARGISLRAHKTKDERASELAREVSSGHVNFLHWQIQNLPHNSLYLFAARRRFGRIFTPKFERARTPALQSQGRENPLVGKHNPAFKTVVAHFSLRQAWNFVIRVKCWHWTLDFASEGLAKPHYVLFVRLQDSMTILRWGSWVLCN